MNQVININGRAVERIEDKRSAVTTLPMIDILHDRPAKTAANAFKRHEERMTEGKHYLFDPAK